MTNVPDPPPDRRSPFEWSLAALRPADAEIARPSFMFKAGQASRDKVVRFWQWVSGGLVVVMVAGGLAAFGTIQAEQQRAESLVAAANARAEAAAQVRVSPTTTETPNDNTVSEPTRTMRLTPSPVVFVSQEPAATEIAAALERRRNILIGGLGLIPDSTPVFTPESPRGTPSYPGVLAAPRVEKQSPLAHNPEPDDPR